MSNTCITFVLILFSLCQINETRKPGPSQKVTVNIDTTLSAIRWKGTKMMYTGSHEGIIRFKSGELVMNGNDVVGGQFVVNMNSIEVTDIPEHEPVPRRNLTRHLEEDFDVARYPTSSLSITKSRDGNDHCGMLTIKGITKEVCFRATKMTAKKWNTKFVVRRNDFAIGEQGSWLEKRLVDQEIELTVELCIQ